MEKKKNKNKLLEWKAFGYIHIGIKSADYNYDSLGPSLDQGNVEQGSRLTFQLSSQVASERIDFTSQNKSPLARLFCII